MPTTALRAGQEHINFTVTDLDGAVERIVKHAPERWMTVTTPNLHHIQMIRKNPALARNYEESAMVLPDGWPVAWLLSRVSRTPVERIAGSDLLERILMSSGNGKPLVLVGGQDEAALDVVRTRAEASQWHVVTEPAPPEEVTGQVSRVELLDRIASQGSEGLVVLGLGAPKQEIFGSELRSRSGSGYILCLGMSINFSAGRTRRAPLWMQKKNLEWMHRMLTEPKRLGPRYIRDAAAFIPTAIENLGSRA